MCGPQVDIPVFVCMTLVSCKFPQEPHGRNVPAVKKTGGTFMKEQRGVSIWSVSGEKYAYKWSPSPKQVNKIHISHGKTWPGVFFCLFHFVLPRYKMYVAVGWFCGMRALVKDEHCGGASCMN